MARSGTIAISFAVLLAIFEVGSCMRCYQCNSQSDPECGDPFKSSKYLVDCSTPDSLSYNQRFLRDVLPREVYETVQGAPRFCHKIVMQTGTVIRTCLDGNPTNLQQTCKVVETASKPLATNDPKKIKHCSVCDKDGCNSAGSLSVSLPLATFAVLASYLFCKQ